MNYNISISVIVPCYNNETSISRAISSILNQSFESFELIVINNDSNDSSDLKIKEFKDSRIIYIKNQKKKGVGATINSGLLMACGKYICLMDSRYIAMPNRLELQYSYLENNSSIGLVGGAYETIDENGNTLEIVHFPLNSSEIKIMLLRSEVVLHTTIMIRSSLIRKNQLFYNETYKYGSEYDFIVRASKLFPITNRKEVLIQYRAGTDQISLSKSIKQKGFYDKIKKEQLNVLGILYSEKEIGLHLKIMNGEYIKRPDIVCAENWIKKLREANDISQVYDKNLFDRLSQYLLIFIKNNGLGGWSIEKKLFDYIQKNFSIGISILEFGSGNGTDALLEFYSVTSIEHDIRYSFNRTDSHQCILAPINNGWYKRNKVKKALKKKCDLIIVDGPPRELRKGILDNLDLLRNINVPVIFDDVNRALDKKIMIEFCNALKYDYMVISGEKKAFAYCTKKIIRCEKGNYS